MYDTGAANYLYGYVYKFIFLHLLAEGYVSRQAMTSTQAWKRHGCYKLGSDQYFNMPFDKALMGCEDDWNALDHFDPTADSRRMFSHFNYLRTVYGALQDGFNLVQRGNWTYFIERPGSNGTATEMGLWSISRAGIDGLQTLNGTYKDVVWMLYTNENVTKTWSYDCKGSSWISSPFQSGVTVRNLFDPYEEYTLTDSLSPYNSDSDDETVYFGCLASVTMQAYGFKALVPIDQWVERSPSLTKFSPGHDHRILAQDDDVNATTVDISLEFDTIMDCDSVTKSISFNMSSSGSSTSAPSITAVNCATVVGVASQIQGGSTSKWAWSATLTDFPDGVLSIIVNQPSSKTGKSTGVRKFHNSPFMMVTESFVVYRPAVAEERLSGQRHGVSRERLRYLGFIHIL